MRGLILSKIVVGVWFGNDNDSPMKKITGGNCPAILWRKFMTAIRYNREDLAIKLMKKNQNI